MPRNLPKTSPSETFRKTFRSAHVAERSMMMMMMMMIIRTAVYVSQHIYLAHSYPQVALSAPLVALGADPQEAKIP